MRQYFKISKTTFMLVCALALTFSTVAMADLIQPEWQAVQDSLDCNGFTISVDAVTDINIPETASEWRAEGRIWTEDELRAFLAIASPGDENMKRHFHEEKNDIALYDDIMDAYASSHLGFVLMVHESRRAGQDEADFPFVNYYSYEPIQLPVPDLSVIRFDESLASIVPIVEALGCDVGYPAEIEAWDLDTLQKNHDWFQANLPDAGFSDRKRAASDEYYRMVFPAYFQGVRLNMLQGEQHPEAEHVDAVIDVEVDAQGVMDFQMRDCLFSEAEPLSEPKKILSLQEALQCYQKMRASMLLIDDEEPITITKILLEYIVLKDFPTTMKYRLVPAWCFYHEYTWEDAGQSYLICEQINAITGEPFKF